ncbi:MAG TPA: alkaline phosphatase family protein [Acidimicrobiales bacterium]|jgi:phospholipase C|nr:alkaline phosphatase family protein [Acidimicrobiales bacterium]
MSTSRFDRRTLLAMALATGGAAVLAAAERGDTARVGAALTRAAASTKAAGSDLGAIEHVVFVMQENRSFDHYYGTYRGVRGFDDHPAGEFGAFAQRWPGGRERTLLPFHLDSASGIGECTTDLDHSWHGQHLSWGRGSNNAFVATHVRPEFEGPENGVLTMGYYRRSDLPFYYALADAFTICDNYHCSVFGPTHPNRLMSLSGTLDPAGHAGGPVLETNSSPDAVYSAHWDTMPEALEDAGVSWKVYSPKGVIYGEPFVEQHGMGTTDAILPYFAQYRDPQSALYQKAFLPVYPDDFMTDIASGSLPAVSWLLPPAGYDEHPSSPPALGEFYTSQVLAALVANPAVWSKTVLFHMYDENDGFFDHVPPPVAPAGTAGEYLGAGSLPADAHGTRGPIGLGFRVPMLVLSPFSRGGHVASQVFDHTSQLLFLEERFGVRAPNISAWRRRTVGNLTSALPALRAGGNATVPSLPSTANDQMANMAALGCSTAALFNIATDLPAYPVPEHQAMPRQEAG